MLLPYGTVGEAAAASYANPPVKSNGDWYLRINVPEQECKRHSCSDQATEMQA